MTGGFSLTTIAFLNLAIGYYVLKQRLRAIPNRTFAFLAITISLWTFGIALAYHSSLDLLLSTALTFAAASLMPLAVLYVFLTFPDEPHLSLDRLSKIFTVLGIAFFVLSFTPSIIATASRHDNRVLIVYGPLYPLYALYICFSLAWSIRILVPRYMNASGLTKLQFRYFLLGLLVPGIAVTITNLLIPLLLNSSRFSQYGPYFALVFLAFTAHALIRYRLMDIRLVLRRGAIFLLAAVASVASVGLAVACLVLLLNWTLSMRDALVLILISTILGVSLPLLNDAFARLLDRYTYRTRADYRATLSQASAALSRILDFDSLASLLVQTVLRVTNSERVALYLKAGSAFHLKLARHYLETRPQTSTAIINANDSVLAFLTTYLEPLVAEELSRRTLPHSTRLISEMADADWAVLVPVSLESRLLGIIAISPKLSRDPFYPEELALLSALASHATAAITNANLYHQVTLANEYINNILATMDSGVIAASNDGTISLFNTAAETMTGISRTLATTSNTTALPLVLADALTETARDGQPRLQVQTTLLDSHHRLLPAMFSTSPLRDVRANVIGAVLVFSDLTTLKHLEMQKQHAERLASLGAIASGLAHEIKNPLVAIKTFAELLPERFSDEDFRDTFSRLVIAEIERIDDLVAKLRGLASVSPRAHGPIDIIEPIEDTFALLRGHLEQKQIMVIRLFEAPSTTVTGDPAQLKQLFLNIFINAIQAMSPRGKLSVSIIERDDNTVPRLAINVRDTGTGIPEEVLPTLFQPFVTTKPFGSGLGLAICRNIADSHRATITAANNDPDPGATISLSFPVRVFDTWDVPEEQLSTLDSPPPT